MKGVKRGRTTTTVLMERCPDCGVAHLSNAARCRECRRPFRGDVAWPGVGWLERPQFRIGDFMLLVVAAGLFTAVARLVPYASITVAIILVLPIPGVLGWVDRLARRGRRVDLHLIARIYARSTGMLWLVLGFLALMTAWLVTVVGWLADPTEDPWARLLDRLAGG